MATIITSEKRYCPYCYWTAVTEKTHCPMVADNIGLHEYNLSVPLLTAGPDTSNYHKEVRSTHQSAYKTGPKDSAHPSMMPLAKIKTDLETIRMMQKRARKKGQIRQSESPIPNLM